MLTHLCVSIQTPDVRLLLPITRALLAPCRRPPPGATMAPCDPAAYQRGQAYIVNTDVEDIYKKQWDSAVSLEDLPRFQEMALFLVDQAPSTERELCAAVILMRRQFKHAPKRSQLAHALRSLQAEGRIPPQPELLRLCDPPGTVPARPALSRPLPSTPAAQLVWTARTHARTHARGHALHPCQR